MSQVLTFAHILYLLVKLTLVHDTETGSAKLHVCNGRGPQ